jgi:hypothetical protein
LVDLAGVLVFVVVFALLVDAFALAAGFEAVLALGLAAAVFLAPVVLGFAFVGLFLQGPLAKRLQLISEISPLWRRHRLAWP